MEAPKHQAEALVRTSIQNVAAKARRESFEANADVIKEVKQVSTLDARTTEICMAYSGKRWSLPDYEPVGHDLPYDGGPPRHWNCRSAEIPVTRSWEELGAEGIDTGGRPAHDPDVYFRKRFREKLEERHADEIRKKTKRQGMPIEDWIDKQVNHAVRNAQASMDGYVPADMDYEAWLRSKPVKFQKEVLGPGKWNLWDQDKLTFSQLVNESGRPLTLAQLQEQTANITPPPVTREMFDALRDKYGFDVTVTEKTVEAWNHEIGRAPDRVMNRLLEGIDNIEAIHFEGGEWRENVEYVKFTILGKDSSFEIQRSINTSTEYGKVAYHELLEIHPDMQGKGFSKRFLKNSMDFYKDIGVNTIEMMASEDVGGYAWARYGFTPRDKKAFDSVKGVVESRAQHVTMSDKDRKVLMNALNSDDPHAIYVIADMGRATRGEGFSIGQQLLLKTHYEAWFQLDDEVAMLRFNKYVGGR